MGLTVRSLKRAYDVRKWRDVFQHHPYIAVVQLTGGRSWGRTNMRARVLGAQTTVDARYAVPSAARLAASQTAFAGLSNLFHAAPSAVIFGHGADDVLDVVARATDILDGGLLVGGRFGESVVHGADWARAADLGGESAVRAGLVRALEGAAPRLVRVLDGGGEGLVRTIGAGGGERVVRVFDAVEKKLSEGA